MMASIDHLHQESLTIKVMEHSDMLYSAVPCELSRGGPRVSWHHNSIPKTHEETLHSTVLTKLSTIKKEILRNLQAHAVDLAIQLQGNRVLKDCPPPIAYEEQSLNRKQRCTLSQLRSEHCHLLQDYKRVFGGPSDICTDYGASPQDMRHLFACTTHPTDLSPEDLWRIRWDQFVRLAISTTETLTDLKTDLVVANNNS